MLIKMTIYTKLYSRIYILTNSQTYMSTIITTSQLQQKIGKITASIKQKSYIVTNRGEGKMIILPYYDGCDRFIEDYLEDYEIALNKEKLEKEFEKSLNSGESNLVI